MYIRITEYVSTVNYQTFVGDFTTAKVINVIEQKSNCTVGLASSVGCFLASKYLGQYNRYEFGDINRDTIEVVNSAGVTVTNPWTLSGLVTALNAILQIETEITGSVTINQKDVEIVEMCDLKGCSDPKGTIHWDGGGSTNVLGLDSPLYNAFTTYIQRVDWGDGTIIDYNNATSMSHTYASNVNPSTLTVRAICNVVSANNTKVGDLMFVVVGSVVFDSGSATSGTWTFNQQLGESKFVKFLRHFVYTSAGAVSSYFDTTLNNIAYVASAFVKSDCCDCEEDLFYTLPVVDNNYVAVTNTTLSLTYGKYNYISIVLLSGTGTLNGVAIAAGYFMNEGNDSLKYNGAVVLVTAAASTALVKTSYIIKL